MSCPPEPNWSASPAGRTGSSRNLHRIGKGARITRPGEAAGGGERRDQEGIWLEPGWRRRGNTGQPSLFLFQLDRIGTGPERGWRTAAEPRQQAGLDKRGRRKKKKNKKKRKKTCARSRSVAVKHTMGKVVHYLLFHSTRALKATAELWVTAPEARKCHTLTQEATARWSSAHIIPLRWLRFRIHSKLLCKDSPIRKWWGGGVWGGESEVAAVT